jgi:hypothetical protein
VTFLAAVVGLTQRTALSVRPISFPQIPSMMTLPPLIIGLSILGAFAGAVVQVLMENRTGRRSKRRNWDTFLVCSIFGLITALALVEYIYRTQEGAKSSPFGLVFVAAGCGLGGHLLASEATAGVKDLARLVIAKLKQIFSALITAPSASTGDNPDSSKETKP